MVTIVAILNGGWHVEKAIKELSESLIPTLQWRIYQSLPGQYAWPLDWSKHQECTHDEPHAAEATKQTDKEYHNAVTYSETQTTPEDYVESLSSGATIILIATPSTYINQIRHLLAQAQATRILIE
mgnify:CR=1 FL=1